MTRAARQRLYRQRVKAGVTVVRVPVDIFDIERLIAAGFLPASDDEKPDRISTAIQSVLGRLRVSTHNVAASPNLRHSSNEPRKTIPANPDDDS